MTNEEAIEQLKKLKSFHNGSYANAIKMAIEAIEKRIPKEPIVVDNHTECPECGCVEIETLDASGICWMRFCPCCGQAILWEVANEE